MGVLKFILWILRSVCMLILPVCGVLSKENSTRSDKTETPEIFFIVISSEINFGHHKAVRTAPCGAQSMALSTVILVTCDETLNGGWCIDRKEGCCQLRLPVLPCDSVLSLMLLSSFSPFFFPPPGHVEACPYILMSHFSSFISILATIHQSVSVFNLVLVVTPVLFACLFFFFQTILSTFLLVGFVVVVDVVDHINPTTLMSVRLAQLKIAKCILSRVMNLSPDYLLVIHMSTGNQCLYNKKSNCLNCTPLFNSFFSNCLFYQ